MRTGTEIRASGFRALVAAWGPVETEKFIALILREPFDYTTWQRGLWPDRGVEEVSKAAMALREFSAAEKTDPPQ